jgi:hypothetical protein
MAAAPGERVRMPCAGGGHHAPCPLLEHVVGPALCLERARVVGHQARLGHELVEYPRQLTRALSATAVVELHGGHTVALEADHPHEHPVRAGWEVHTAKVDPLVLEHQLAGADRVRARYPIEGRRQSSTRRR